MQSADDRGRDANSLTILGWFFVVLALLVLLSTFWSFGDGRALLVTLICGGVLLAVGAGMATAGKKLRSAQSAEANQADG